MKQLGWWLVLVALCLSGLALPVAAQKTDPPPPYAEFQFDADAEQLTARIKKTGALEKAIKRMVEDVRKNPDKYKALFENLDINDPTLKNRLRQDPFVRNLINEYKNADKDALDDWMKKDKVETPIDPNNLPPIDRPPNKPGPPNPIKKKLPNNLDNQPEAAKPALPKTPAQEEQDQLGRWMADVMKRLDRSALGEQLAKSEAWKKGMQSLEGFWNDKKFGDFQLGQDALQKLTERFKFTDNWQFKLHNPLPRMNGAPVPLPRPNLNMGNPGGWFHFGSAPRPGSGGALPEAGALGFSQTLLWLGVVAAIVVVVYMVLRRQGLTLGRRNHPTAQAADWPFPPYAITTRAELIATFEYLSLLLLGPDARTWNHKDIAAAVGDPDRATPDKQRAATELAALYEQARYTPDEGPLTPAAVAAARHNLCLLAGVSHA